MSAAMADDLFAGAGGWDLAAAQLGIHARGVENMKEARATRDAAGLTTIHDDVWTFAPDGNAAGLIASPPCQTFSAAGKGSGRKALEDVLRGIRDGYVDSLDHLRFLGLEVGDERTSLVLTPLHFALTGGYEWLAWEQVPTVLPVWEACAETGGAEPIAKLARYAGRPDWIDRCASGSGITGPVHRPVTHPAATVTGAGNFETHALEDCRKMALDSIRLTVAEAGILQSFPANYPWQGTKGKQYLQAGNAVPPGLALHALGAAAGIDAREVAA